MTDVMKDLMQAKILVNEGLICKLIFYLLNYLSLSLYVGLECLHENVCTLCEEGWRHIYNCASVDIRSLEDFNSTRHKKDNRQKQVVVPQIPAVLLCLP